MRSNVYNVSIVMLLELKLKMNFHVNNLVSIRVGQTMRFLKILLCAQVTNKFLTQTFYQNII